MNRSECRAELRKRMRDWYTPDVLAAAIVSTAATTFAATLGEYYKKGKIVGIEDEEMLVRDVATNTVTVVRGWHGTTPATHVISTPVRIFNFFSDAELNSYINRAVKSLWPDVYGRDVDEQITLVSGTYKYEVPAEITDALGVITDIERLTDDERGIPLPFEVWGEYIYFKYAPDAGARIKYIYPFPVPAADDDDIATPDASELVILEAQVSTWEAVMCDRDKYERYVTSQWADNASGYEIESHVSSLKESALDERDRLRMARQSAWRWV